MNELNKEQDALWVQCPEGAIQHVVDSTMSQFATTHELSEEQDNLWVECSEGAIAQVSESFAARLLAIKEQDELWVKCPEGAIQEVSASNKVSRAAKPAVDLQRRKLLVATATAAGVAVFGGVSYLAVKGPAATGNGPVPGAGGGPIATFNHGGINCIEVMRSIPAYVDNKLADSEKSEKIKQHLELCEKCRELYQYNLEG